MSGKKDKKHDQAEPIITPVLGEGALRPSPVLPPGNRFTSTSRNVGTATFSSMAKQAESLVNGDNSITFNTYNNNAVFRSARTDINDSVSIDIINKTINNVSAVVFNNNTLIQGISDGYTVNNQGAMVPLYDSNIALSTAFGYEYAQTTDNLRKDLNIEIERRKYDHSVLLSSFQQTSEACEHAVRMIHYIDYDTENHAVNIVIPYENAESQTTSFVDDMPSETIAYDDINTDPSTGVIEFAPRASEQRTVVSINRDGTIIDGSAVVSSDLTVPAITVETLTFPSFSADVPGAVYKHPFRGRLVEIPESKDDDFYRVFGGVRGDTIINPNKGLTERYAVPEGTLFDCEQPWITKKDISYYSGKVYIGVNHESVLAGLVVQLPLTVGEEITDEARLLMELLDYSPEHAEVSKYTNPNYRMVGYLPLDDILFDTKSDTVWLQLQYKYIFIDSTATLNDIYYTPAHTITSIADTVELPLDNIIPTVRAVMEHVSDKFAEYDVAVMDIIRTLIQQLAETISFDLDVKQYALEYNAALTDYVINSTGGLDKEPEFNMPVNPRPGEIPDFSAPAQPTDWALWINVRKWVVQGIIDSLLRKNGQKYWNDCPNYDILNQYLSFAAALGQVSSFDEEWSWEFFKGDILTWNVGGSSTLSGNSVRFKVHSENYSSTSKMGGYFCSGSAGFHTNNWIYVGDSSNVPDCNEITGGKYNFVCKGDAHFHGYTNVSDTFRFLIGSTLQFQQETIEYAFDKEKAKFMKQTSFDELMNRIDNLETENTELKNRVQTLEADVAYLKQLVKHFTI